MHFVQAKGILSAKNGMNIYRGCTHGCIYCDSRSLCYGFTHDFEDIEVKQNALELLEDALRHKRQKCMIGTGAMCDPYIPLEKKLCYTREAMKLVCKYGFGMAVQTKSDLVLRDIDLMSEINRKAKFVFQMTLTTADDALCKIIEPCVCPTSERIKVIKEVRRMGIPTVVWLCPILPFINDTSENIDAIVDMCRQTGVYGIINFGMGLTLRNGNREYFYDKLDKHFRGLKQRYISAYGTSYVIDSPKAAELYARFCDRCDRAGIIHGNDKLFAYLNEFPSKQGFEQLSMF